MFVLPHYWCSILFQRAKKSLMSDIENLFIFVSLETDLQISVLQYATSFQNQMQVPEMWFFFVFLRDSWSEWGKKPDVLWWPQQELWVVITRILPPIYHNKAGGGGGRFPRFVLLLPLFLTAECVTVKKWVTRVIWQTIFQFWRLKIPRPADFM